MVSSGGAPGTTPTAKQQEDALTHSREVLRSYRTKIRELSAKLQERNRKYSSNASALSELQKEKGEWDAEKKTLEAEKEALSKSKSALALELVQIKASVEKTRDERRVEVTRLRAERNEYRSKFDVTQGLYSKVVPQLEQIQSLSTQHSRLADEYHNDMRQMVAELLSGSGLASSVPKTGSSSAKAGPSTSSVAIDPKTALQIDPPTRVMTTPEVVVLDLEGDGFEDTPASPSRRLPTPMSGEDEEMPLSPLNTTPKNPPQDV